jgi:hypothetical protein
LFFLVDVISDVCHSFWAELLAEVESLHSAADILADFIRALTRRWEERLLGTRALMQAVIECSVHRGVAVALMVAQAAIDMEL